MTFKQLLIITIMALTSLAASGNDAHPFSIEPVTSFDEPWAMAFLPDGRMLVTEKKGNLLIVTSDGKKSRPVSGLPNVAYGGQGGLGDIALHPDFTTNSMVYLSFAESTHDGSRGAAVLRGRLDIDARRPALQDVDIIWRQYPKFSGNGHYGHRMLFDADGYLWITSGDRQKFTPAQDMQSNVGKIIRLNDDGSIPSDNPFVNYRETNPLVGGSGVYDELWSIGHRNPLGIAEDLDGRIWVIEMGPLHGDELNLIRKAGNYGYPVVSDGDHYDRREIPDHSTRPEFDAPAVSWVPAISPSHLAIIEGKLFKGWRGHALASSLSAQAIVRIEIDGEKAQEVERYDMGARIRSVTEGPDGAIWILEDERGDSQGRLLKLLPR